MPNVFTFKNGYQFWVKENYNPLLVDLAVSTWRAEHPQPEPTTKFKVVPIKGGTDSIPYKDWSDPTYIALYSVWLSDLQNFQETTTIKEACELSKLDPQVLVAARNFAEDHGLRFFPDDALLYVRVVAIRKVLKGEKMSEYDTFVNWLKELEGPSEALIDMFLKNNLQNGSDASGQDDGSLVVPDIREPKSAKAKTAQGAAVAVVDLQGSR